jgi:predicted ATPase
LSVAADSLDQLTSHPYWQVMPGFHSEGFAMQGELHLLRGEFAAGAEVLRQALTNMKASRQTSLRPITECRLAEAMIALGQPDEARALIADAFAHVPASVESVDAPELLRVKAAIMLGMPTPDAAEAEECLAQSLALARRQCAKGWELRSTITMARLRATQQRDAEARHLLSAIYGQITEGRETRDLAEATELLRELGFLDRSGDAVNCVE